MTPGRPPRRSSCSPDRVPPFVLYLDSRHSTPFFRFSSIPHLEASQRGTRPLGTGPGAQQALHQGPALVGPEREAADVPPEVTCGGRVKANFLHLLDLLIPRPRPLEHRGALSGSPADSRPAAVAQVFPDVRNSDAATAQAPGDQRSRQA